MNPSPLIAEKGYGFITGEDGADVFVHFSAINGEEYKFQEEAVMINKLIEKIRKTNAPIVVGLDPMLNYIPKHIQENAFAEFGETLEGAAEAIWQFNKGIVDATYDLIPAVKPQIAMYEQFGIPGLQAYKKTVDYCKSKDLVVIGDIKRGDIGSTSAAYAVGHLGHVQVGSWNSPLEGLDVFTRINRPLFSSLKTSINGFTPSEPRYGLTVAKSSSNPAYFLDPT